MSEVSGDNRNVPRVWRLGNVRLSACISLAALVVSASYVTWHFMAAAALAGTTTSIIEVLGWVFWMITLSVIFIWACWVRTQNGWRWRWRRF